MRIAQISTVGTPVRRDGSDSVEHLVWLLTRELTQLGHDVTVFAAAGSEVSGRLVETLPGQYGVGGGPQDWRFCEVNNLAHAIQRSAEFDILHSHSYLWGLALERLSSKPMVHTLHITPFSDVSQVLALSPHVNISAISHYQWSGFPSFKPAAVIHHGVDPTPFTFRESPDDYLFFLGRFVPEKGALTAIAAARALGIRLILAGAPSEPYPHYFRDFIEPEIDGKLIQYVGKVAGEERDRLLGGARALLYPIEDPEPFGLVQVEAMLCGTPVVAMSLGAVPEIVEEGVTGCLATTADEFIEAIPRALGLNRRRIRAEAEQRFSPGRMAAEYVALYQRLAGGPSAS